MERVSKRLQERRAEVAAHPFFRWMNSETVPLERRFAFTPVMIDFIMGFADMNKWFLSYAEPKDPLEKAINDHTVEDRTHSRLFVHNWYAVDLGDISRWPASKTLWWLFESEDSAVVRRFGMRILDMAVNHADPLVRFSMMEAIEICGDVFFGNTSPIAMQLSAEHGIPHYYFGEFHRARETGHLHADESVFLGVELSSEQWRDSDLVVQCVFDNFLSILDRLLSYSSHAAADPSGLERALDQEFRASMTRPGDGQVVSPSQAPLVRLLADRKQRLRSHSFLRWLRENDGTPEIEKLRRFVALWGIDIVGYQDFNELVLRYPIPNSAAERAINQWTEDLATHGRLYLQDWRALDMDRVLGWDMGETIAFYFLSEQTEIHRRNMAKVKKYAFRYKEPVMRWWLMKALEASGEPLFECTAPLAESAEVEGGVTLHYWANRHHLAHPKRSRGEDFAFAAEELSPPDRDVAIEMINTIFDNVAEQFSLSHREVERGTFVAAPSTLPPPRMSEIILRAEESAASKEGERREAG